MYKRQILLFAYNNNGYISDRGNELRITSDSSPIRIRTLNYGGDPENGDEIATFKPGGAVDLYHTGTKRFETLSGGAKVTGDLEVTGTINGTVGSGGGIPSGVIVAWSGLISAIPTGFVLCNGANGTPDLRNRFVIGASSDTTVTSSTFAGITLGGVSGYAKRSGGNKDATLVSHSHTLSHSHTFSGTVSNTNLSHSHSYQSANHPTGSGPEQNQTGSPEDRTTFNVNKTTGSALGNHNHTFSGTTSGASTSTTNTQGSSSTNANLPPYYSLAFIMKT